MLFGLKNAPAAVQEAKDVILGNVSWQYALFYIGDTIVYSRTPEDYSRHMKEVPEFLNNTEIMIKMTKCSFFSDPIDYHSHVTAPGKLHIATKNTKAIRALQYPTTVSQLQSFSGLCNGYRSFVPNFAKLASTLNKKLI